MVDLIKKIRFIGIIIKNRKDPAFQFSAIFSIYLKLLTKLFFIVKLGNGKLTQETILGYSITCFDYGALIAMFESSFIEREYYFTTSSKNPIIFDIGSNIGISVLYFKHYYPNAKIVAFEPDPTTYAVLKKNIEQNHFQNVQLHEIAISDKKSTAPFFMDRNNPGSLTMSLKKERLPKDMVAVKTDLLSSYIHFPIDLLKMDVEGSENLIITDLDKKGLFKKIKNIFFEYHHHIDVYEDALSKTLAILEKNKFGYQLVSKLRSPFVEKKFQDIMIYAYKK